MAQFAIYSRKSRKSAKIRTQFGGKDLTVTADNKRDAVNIACSRINDLWLSAEEITEGDRLKRD